MIEAVRILIYLRPTQLKRGPTQNENLVQIKCTPKHSAICFKFLQKWTQNTTSRDMNSFFQRPEFLLLSSPALLPLEPAIFAQGVVIIMIQKNLGESFLPFEHHLQT